MAIIGCPDCNGYGYHGHTNPRLGDECETCEGTGLAPQNGRSEPCDRCGGEGFVVYDGTPNEVDPCPKCGALDD